MSVTAPGGTSINPRKFFQGDWSAFLELIKAQPITYIERHGKHLFVRFKDLTDSWHIHLSSTGWFMPGNELAARATNVDQIHENFLHSISPRDVRVKFHFDDGQVWLYHDPRTWGKWWVRDSENRETYLAQQGPDWYVNPKEAESALKETKTRRLLKDVLCDQGLTSGIGNYLACEIVHRAKLHPHHPYQLVDADQRSLLVDSVHAVLKDSGANPDHKHWRVFKLKGTQCPSCHSGIVAYVKDRGDTRGSYFCPECQPHPAPLPTGESND